MKGKGKILSTKIPPEIADALRLKAQAERKNLSQVVSEILASQTKNEVINRPHFPLSSK